MMEKMNGLSLDLIIHPGETIKEVLEEKEMSQEELAIRTGFSPKHVSEVVNGKKGISPSFAKSLEYALGLPTSFWINLQGKYDKEILEYEEQENINKEEINITKKLKDLIKYAKKLNIISKSENLVSEVIDLRKLCNVKNLEYISNLEANQVAYRKSKTIDTDFYVLYVWIRICEIMADRTKIDDEYNENKLRSNISNIKNCMFLNVNDAMKNLKSIFASCGIIFQVVKNFQGAPVQGFIKKNDDRIILTMTIRQSYADVFWFTLFHEIGHLLNGDIDNKQYIDFENSESDMEDKAGEFAKETLIDEKDYEDFINKNELTETSIIKFAKEQNVAPFIVVGRIQKERNDYKMFNKLKVRYKWES